MSPDRVFVDTAYLQALVQRNDRYHATAREWLPVLRALDGWVTEAVLIEFGNAMSAYDRLGALRVIRSMYETPNIHVVPVDTPLLARALSLYEQRPDKQWGLTDCISFVVMQDHHLIDALTADHHFEQAGFRALLAEPA